VRRSPFTLVLFAVVIATLAVATTAFATMEKTVRLDVDGRQVAVSTVAGDVAGVLRKAHLDLDTHDTVAPDVRAPVHDGSQVIVRHGRLITLTVGGQVRHVWVTALSVGGKRSTSLQLRADGAWMSASRSQSIPREGLSLQLRMPQHVTVLVDGHRRTRVTTAATVRDLLRSLHVRLRRLDRVNVPLTKYPRTGLVVSVARISQRTVTDNVAIPFRTKQISTSDLYGRRDAHRSIRPARAARGDVPAHLAQQAPRPPQAGHVPASLASGHAGRAGRHQAAIGVRRRSQLARARQPASRAAIRARCPATAPTVASTSSR